MCPARQPSPPFEASRLECFDGAGSRLWCQLPYNQLVVAKSQTTTMIERVCAMPVEFHARGDISWTDLLQASGYLQSPETLTTDAVEAHLRKHPALIDAWTLYSLDKRYSPAWYLIEIHDSLLELGYYPDGPRLCFTDRFKACAEFIVRDLAASSAPRVSKLRRE
jgi:hypothetical protein